MAGKDSITIIAPDDFHHHFRDGSLLKAITPLVLKQFNRAIAMPNLTPPVVSTDMAVAYRQRIIESIPGDKASLEPLMTLYLTDNTSKEELVKAKESGVVFGCKMYPAHATTNSAFGVTSIDKVKSALIAMEELDLVLLVHGEVMRQNDQLVDIFKREKLFIETVLPKIISGYPNLRVVLEHITTKDSVDFLLGLPDEVKIAATITPQHFMFDRNKIFEGNLIRPHNFCLPILKSSKHHLALENLIRSYCDGSLTRIQKNRFFCGTDSAAHPLKNKLNKDGNNCGCAGVFSAATALEFYLEKFIEISGYSENTISCFEEFVSKNGANFYKLPLNTNKITLKRGSYTVPKDIPLETGDVIVPFLAGEQLSWKVV